MTTSVTDIGEQIKQLKLTGNEYFGQKQYAMAIKYYTKGIDHTIYKSDISDNQPLIELRQSLLLNRAKSHFKHNNLKDALIDSSNCIKTCDGTKLSFKAHYTRSEIYLHLNDYKNALKHCDKIINAPNPTGMTSLQQRTKKLIKQIKEQSITSTTKKSKRQHRSRPNNIVNAMTLSIGEHRKRIEKLQHEYKINNNKKPPDVVCLISSKWWRKWYNIDGNKKLDEMDISILNVNNSDLIKKKKECKEEEEEKKDNDSNNNEEIIEIASTYLDHNLLPNLVCGRANDYILLNFAAYQAMLHMGYKMKPSIWVKNIEQLNTNKNIMEKRIEIYKTRYSIYFNSKKVYLLCSINETIRKLCTEIARYFVIQSSSIRLRYKNKNGLILDRSHTLSQHGVLNKYSIYVEIRLPNGCWPIKSNLDKYHENESRDNDDDNNNKPTIVCQSCQRLITHYVSCPKQCDDECTSKYCNINHVASHWKYHEREHKINFSIPPRWGLAGLVNLGNTCYMNSSLQCLSYIAELRSYLTCDDYRNDININNPLGYKGELASIFASFLKKMWFGLDTIISPRDIRNKIAVLYDQWHTSQQQDAEEFIRWLLDGLHEDLNLILKKPYYELKDSNNRSDEIVANEHWTLHLKRNQSIIVDLFQGQYKSTLICPSCDAKSVKFDAFSGLTLPIPDKDTMISVNCLVFSSDPNKYPYKLQVNVSRKAVVTQLTDILSEKLNKYLQSKQEEEEKEEKEEKKENDNNIHCPFSSDNLLLCKVSDYKFGKYWSSGRPIKIVIAKNRSNNTYIYQVKTTTIAKRKQDDLVQVRMNFCYKQHHDLHSNSSGDSDDDYNITNIVNGNGGNNNDNDKDNRIYFAYPVVFDVLLTQFTGNNMYEYFKKKLQSFSNKQENKTKLPPLPQIQMFLRRDNKEHLIEFNDKQLELTNNQRNVATIFVEFVEYEYKLYIDQSLALKSFDFNLISDIKPKGYTDLYDCLKLYTAAEVLDDGVWKCSKCKKTTQPSKQLHLWRLPEILIIHLKRFLNETGYFGGHGKKNTLPIKTPINGLDLSPYLSDNTNINIPKYDLFATVNHHGIMDFGHYYSCVRTDFSTQITNFYQHYQEVDNPKWNLFNDDKVQQISIDDLQQYTKDAYLLFYRRRNNV